MTEKGDVYGFGVVALEVIMGRHPGELISQLSKLSKGIMLKDILDSCLQIPLLQKDVQDLVLVVMLALSCLNSQSKSWPSMRQVIHNLLVSKPLLPKSFTDISIQELMRKEIYQILGLSLVET